MEPDMSLPAFQIFLAQAAAASGLSFAFRQTCGRCCWMFCERGGRVQESLPQFRRFCFPDPIEGCLGSENGKIYVALQIFGLRAIDWQHGLCKDDPTQILDQAQKNELSRRKIS